MDISLNLWPLEKLGSPPRFSIPIATVLLVSKKKNDFLSRGGVIKIDPFTI